jgi:hypothetical protein
LLTEGVYPSTLPPLSVWNHATEDYIVDDNLGLPTYYLGCGAEICGALSSERGSSGQHGRGESGSGDDAGRSFQQFGAVAGGLDVTVRLTLSSRRNFLRSGIEGYFELEYSEVAFRTRPYEHRNLDPFTVSSDMPHEHGE